MLNTKKMLTKLSKRVNFRQTYTSKSNVSIAANGYTSVTLPAPSSGTPIAVTGYMITGTGNTSINVYGIYLSGGAPTLYLKNTVNSAATVTVTAYMLVVD